jgi:hypothetical protein
MLRRNVRDMSDRSGIFLMIWGITDIENRRFSSVNSLIRERRPDWPSSSLRSRIRVPVYVCVGVEVWVGFGRLNGHQLITFIEFSSRVCDRRGDECRCSFQIWVR